jgi:hypothetical protein
MTPEQQNEMMTNLQAMSEMLTLLDRMTALDDVLMAEPIQHTRWAMTERGSYAGRKHRRNGAR